MADTARIFAGVSSVVDWSWSPRIILIFDRFSLQFQPSLVVTSPMATHPFHMVVPSYAVRGRQNVILGDQRRPAVEVPIVHDSGNPWVPVNSGRSPPDYSVFLVGLAAFWKKV